MKKWLLVMALLVSLVLCGAALADTYNVYTMAELSAAFTTINSAGGEHTISLQADLTGVTSPSISKGTITLVGNGHSIQMATRNMFHLGGSAVLNLGDGTSELTIIGTNYNDDPGLFYVGRGSTVNMYDGVTLKDNQTKNYLGGGFTLQGGTLNMYGGTIDNCSVGGGSVCFGGGVAVFNGGLFNMSGGTIKNCYATTSLPGSNKGLIPWGAGGGVFVGGGSTFNMTGGTIENCSVSESGGGVFVVASIDSYFNHGGFGFVDSRFTMSGGSIKECSAPYYGGGIAVDGYYVNASAIATTTPSAGTPSNPGIYISGGDVTGNEASIGGGLFVITTDASVPVNVAANRLCNNTANAEGADLYLQATKVALSAPTMVDTKYLGGPASAKNKIIDGWYMDANSSGDRYEDQNAADREEVSTGTATFSGDGIIAAVNSCTVTFDVQGHGTAPQDQAVHYGDAAVLPADPTAQGWTFEGWYTEAACENEYDFSAAVTEDITLYALWTKKPVPTNTPTPVPTNTPTPVPTNTPAPTKPPVPPTGDSFNLSLYLLLAIGSSIILVLARKRHA